MTRILHLAGPGLVFGLAKSTVFLAPLLAAAVLSQAAYGRVEWWLAISLTLGPVVGMGASGVVAYGTIAPRLRRHVRTATIFAVTVAALLWALALTLRLFYGEWHEAPYSLIFLQTSLICLQTTFVSRLKGLGKGTWASVLESTVYTSLFFALLTTTIGLDFVTAYAYLLLTLSALLAAGLVRCTHLPKPSRWLRRNYRAFLHCGSRFMIGSALMGAFMAAPRVILGVLSNPERVAEFALAFRWLSTAILTHQFINTIFFSKLFGNGAIEKRLKILTRLIGIVGLSAVSVIFFIRIAPLAFPAIPIPENTGLLTPIGVGIILWATTACLEGSLYRLAAPSKQTRSVALGCIALLAAAFICTASGMDLTYSVTYAWLFGLSTIIGFQYSSLRTLGESFSSLLKLALAMSTFFAFSAEIIIGDAE